MRPFERTLAKVECGFFKLVAINVDKQKVWKENFFALFLTSVNSIFFLILVLTSQNYLPSALSTAVSFITNTRIDIVSIDYNKPETVAGALKDVNKLFLVTLPSPDMANITSHLFTVLSMNVVNCSSSRTDISDYYTASQKLRL